MVCLIPHPSELLISYNHKLSFRKKKNLQTLSKHCPYLVEFRLGWSASDARGMGKSLTRSTVYFVIIMAGHGRPCKKFKTEDKSNCKYVLKSNVHFVNWWNRSFMSPYALPQQLSAQQRWWPDGNASRLYKISVKNSYFHNKWCLAVAAAFAGYPMHHFWHPVQK